jgi:hypothetical protein
MPDLVSHLLRQVCQPLLHAATNFRCFCGVVFHIKTLLASAIRDQTVKTGSFHREFAGDRSRAMNE